MSLYEDSQLMAALSAALEGASDGADEDYQQALYDTLEGIEASFTETAEAICKIISNEIAYQSGVKTEQDRLTAAMIRSKGKVDSLKRYLKVCLEQAGLKKAEAGTYKISIAKNGGKLPLVIDDEANLPLQFKRITTSADTEAIRKYLEGGNQSPYFHFGERGESVRIK